MSYDVKYRKRVVEYKLDGNTLKKTSETFKVSPSTIKEWLKQYRESGHLEKKELKRRHKKIDPEKLKEYVANTPDAYLQEIADEFGCDESSVRKALKKLKITRKKRS